MTITKSRQDSLTNGLRNAADAARRSTTAPRLAAAGTMALGAAAYFYFADPARRAAATQAATRMFERLTSWWQGSSANDMSTGAPAETAANPGAAGIA
jgi:hypothetical protein